MLLETFKESNSDDDFGVFEVKEKWTKNLSTVDSSEDWSSSISSHGIIS
jgi:hypothetical protein